MPMNFIQHFTGNKGMVFHNLHDDVLDNFNTEDARHVLIPHLPDDDWEL